MTGGTRPIRVLHIITRLIVGGAQENTLLTAIGQHRDPRYVATLVYGRDDGPEGDLAHVAREAGLTTRKLPSLVRPIRPFADLAALGSLIGMMRAGRFDVVHTHSSKAGILGRIAARLAGVPVVVHTIHGLPFHPYQSEWTNRLYVALERLSAPLADAIISVSERNAQAARAAGIGRSEQHVTIFSGMDVAGYAAIGDALSVADARRRVGLPPDDPVVGKVARLFPLKGHHEFLEVARRIAHAEPRTRFLLVGDGILRAELAARAEGLGLADRVTFTGLVPPAVVPALMQAMDVVVHTSLREGIARVLPQAGAVGKPVVTYDLDGAPEVIRDGVSGYLVPPRDVALLAERVVGLLGDAELRRRMGEAGRAFALEHFGTERMVERIGAVYERALAARGRGRD